MKKSCWSTVVIFQILVIAIPLGLVDLFLFDVGRWELRLQQPHPSALDWSPGTVYNHGEPGVLLNPKIYTTAWNSIKLVPVTAFFTALLGVILGYAIVKGRGTRLSKLVEQLAYIPYVIPGIAFGAVYIAMFARKLGPLPPLYGTFACWSLFQYPNIFPIHPGQASQPCCKWAMSWRRPPWWRVPDAWRRFRKIIFPLTTSGFVSGFLLTFITTMRELSLIILLVTPATQLLASQTMFYTENGDGQMANIVILILIALVALGNFIIGRVTKGGSLKKGLGF